MKKLGELSKVLAVLLAVALLSGLFPTGTVVNLKTVDAATTLNNPRIVADSSMEAGQRVTWDCVWFGAYPQSEVTGGSIYTTLKKATGWDANNDIIINGSKYRRLRGQDAMYATSGSSNHYDWNNSYGTYHYFKYEPIKWRVLNRNGNDAFLLADVVLDTQKYNISSIGVTWETSNIRSWLNGYSASVNQPRIDYSRKNFINTAFTSVQQNAIYTTKVVNNNNLNYGTAGGSDTSDKIFLLSESEIYNTDIAVKYGFVKDYDPYDEARRSYCSIYAYAMGAYRYFATDGGENIKYNGNVMWWLRSMGDDNIYATLVNYYGRILRNGHATSEKRGVRPTVHLDIESSNVYSYAGTVCSDGTMDERAPDLIYVNPIPSGESGDKDNGSNKNNDSNKDNGNNKNNDGNKDNSSNKENNNKNTTTSPSKPKPTASTTKKKPSNPIASLSGVLKSVKSPAKSTLLIKWKKLNKVTGYQVQLCLKSNFKKGTIQRMFKQKVTSTKVRPLKKNKKYYVRIRPYVKSGSKKYYGKWSKVKGVKIK